jgi:peptide/nickel transport system substrate-binding protein
VFHSNQAPPIGFNRGHYSNPEVDALLDEAAASTDETRRLELFRQVQHLLIRDLPYISLWNKTNFVIAQPSLDGVRASTLGDFTFLKDVARIPRPVVGEP